MMTFSTTLGASTTNGVVVLTSATGQAPACLPFESLAFSHFDTLRLIEPDGSLFDVADISVGKIVYFDQPYYNQLHTDSSYLQYGQCLEPRESLINLSFSKIISTDDLTMVRSSRNSLAEVASTYPCSDSLLQPLINDLQSEIDQYGDQKVYVNGEWIKRDDFLSSAPAKSIGAGSQSLTFTTRAGKKYENVKVTVTGSGISILTNEGGETISFADLPVDLQKRFGYQAEENSSPQARAAPTLDQKCASFLKDQINLSDANPSADSDSNDYTSLLRDLDNAKIVRVATTDMVNEPLFLNGRQVGQEALPPGTILNLSLATAKQLIVYDRDPNSTFVVPITSTNWQENALMIDGIRTMYGFIQRVNQILSDSETRMTYDPVATKRFKISTPSGDYWSFNPEDLSTETPPIYDQSEASEQDTYLEYSQLRAIGYADQDTTLVAADSQTAAAVSHTELKKTVYFVTVKTRGNEELLDTSEPGEIQRKRLIFRIEDRADATELSSLFSDFCRKFSSLPSDDSNSEKSTNHGVDSLNKALPATKSIQSSSPVDSLR